MWNHTDQPLALLITFRCRGTWLHGDERGSIDRFHNVHGSPRIKANSDWKNYNTTLLKGEPAYLSMTRRSAVEKAIKETCKIRNWLMYALNIRTNHGHCVIAPGGHKPSLVLHALKANATRQMREDKCWEFPYSPWVDKGSVRRLWNERHIEAAVNYVLYGQGEDLPKFD